MVRSPILDGWLDAAQLAPLEALYRDRSVLCIGDCGAPVLALLIERGLARLVVVVGDAEEGAAVRARFAGQAGGGGARLEVRVGAPAEDDGRFDLLLALRAERLGRDFEMVAALKQRLHSESWLVAAAPVDAEGRSYHGLREGLGRHFAAVTMLAASPLSGVSLAPFGETEVEPWLDSVMQGAAPPLRLVAVAGPRALTPAWSAVLLPEEACAPAAVAATPDEKQAEELALARAQAACAELEARLATREQGIEQMRAAALQHVEEMKALRAVLDERDAYIAELERAQKDHEQLRGELQETRARADAAEAKERTARLRIAELEGLNLRLEREQGAPGTAGGAASEKKALEERLAELEARAEKLKKTADDAQREAWAHMRARSEAEAAAAEVREDTVRKLKDARKLANVELMRAMEEATKKAVSLKEELVRTERERKEGQAALKVLREELAALQAAIAELREEKAAVERQASERLHEVRSELGEALEQACADRDQALTRLELAERAFSQRDLTLDRIARAEQAIAEREQLLVQLAEAERRLAEVGPRTPLEGAAGATDGGGERETSDGT